MRTQQAKQLSLPELLSRLGHQPAQISGDKLWYRSPWRSEARPSFCVKPGRVVGWVFADYGANIQGNILDFVMRYQHCDLKAALLWLAQVFDSQPSTATISRPALPSASSEILLYRIKEIQHPALRSYIKSRAIELDLAKRYLREVHYYNRGRPMFALGWKNDAGGWSLRAKDFKASVRPAGITTIGTNNLSLAIFEGIFDFLAALAYYQISAPRAQVIILNGVNHAQIVLEKIIATNYRSIKLFLDNDLAGRQATLKFLALNNTLDYSTIFSPAKDFAQWYQDRI